jgi:hypothetical protein
MDIRQFARRNAESAAQSSKWGADARQMSDAAQVAQVAQTVQPSAAGSGQGQVAGAGESSADRPASISRFTPAGRLVNVLQSFEQRHPEETKQVLSNIADRLRADAEEGGPFSARLTRWADRFQSAAESGDMSELMPRFQPHFGLRAYEQAQQADSEDTVAHVAGTAESQSGAARAAAESGATISSAPTAVVPATTSSTDTTDVSDQAATRSDTASDLRNQPVTVPESATANDAVNVRNWSVTVPESSQMSAQ